MTIGVSPATFSSQSQIAPLKYSVTIFPPASPIRTAMISASGATPVYCPLAPWPLPAAIPAQAVPWLFVSQSLICRCRDRKSAVRSSRL